MHSPPLQICFQHPGGTSLAVLSSSSVVRCRSARWRVARAAGGRYTGAAGCRKPGTTRNQAIELPGDVVDPPEKILFLKGVASFNIVQVC